MIQHSFLEVRHFRHKCKKFINILTNPAWLRNVLSCDVQVESYLIGNPFLLAHHQIHVFSICFVRSSRSVDRYRWRRKLNSESPDRESQNLFNWSLSVLIWITSHLSSIPDVSSISPRHDLNHNSTLDDCLILRNHSISWEIHSFAYHRLSEL